MDVKRDSRAVKIKNFMEDIVFGKLDDLIEASDCCKCDICRMDIAAYALNQLPPRYVATREGEVYAKISSLYQQFEVDVTMAILKAIKVVSANPRHPAGEGNAK